METLTLVMLIFAAILASSIIDQVVPRVSSPLIQIGLGLLIALFSNSSHTRPGTVPCAIHCAAAL